MLGGTEFQITPTSVLTLDRYKRKQCWTAKPPRRLNVAERMQHQQNTSQKYVFMLKITFICLVLVYEAYGLDGVTKRSLDLSKIKKKKKKSCFGIVR